MFINGGGDVAIYGQTFKLTSNNNKLDNFTFYLKNWQSTRSISFDAYVYKWDSMSSKVIGGALFESKNLSAITNSSTSTPINVSTNGVKLQYGQEYVIFLSSLGYTQNLGQEWLLSLDNVDGSFVYLDINNFSSIDNQWSYLSPNYVRSSFDLAYILNFSQWLTAQDTMVSMQSNILGLNQIFTMQADALESSLPQKCTYFNSDNVCISFITKYAQVKNSSNVDATSGIVNVAYKINSNFYAGGSLEQIVSDINYSDVNYRQKAPDISVYTGWNQKENSEGLNAHIAYRHSNGKVNITRKQINSAEAGNGHSDLTSDAWYASLGNTFNVQDKALVTPYIALRYSDIERKAYTEDLSDDVTVPLSYDNLSRKTITAILGVEAITALTPEINLSGTVGYENDLEKKFSDYSATGMYDLTPLDFNEGYKNNRLFLSTGIDYNFAKNQNFGVNVSYRESAFNSSSVTSASIVYQTSF